MAMGGFLLLASGCMGGGTPGFLSRLRQYPEQQVSTILLFNSDQMSLEPILNAVDTLIVG